jgi:hypothetical protein
MPTIDVKRTTSRAASRSDADAQPHAKDEQCDASAYRGRNVARKLALVSDDGADHAHCRQYGSD